MQRSLGPHNSFPVVGLGASAGGLEALTELLEALPSRTGMAFVVLQHLGPNVESVLPHLLARVTSMPVLQVTQNLRLKPNHVYVIPPAKYLLLSDGKLKLLPRQGGKPPRVIDFFLQSLAQECGQNAIGVILSGTGADGTLGLQGVRAEGGITFAQDHSAKFESMPRSAVAAGCVDYVLDAARIGQELGKLARHPYVARQRAVSAELTTNRLAHERFGKVLALLQKKTGADFRAYKLATLERRLHRRILLGRFKNLAEYLGELTANPGELAALERDFVIGVTHFFREPEAFAALRTQVFPKCVKALAAQGGQVLRVWTLGCSTGQESYSLAMTWLEYAEHVKTDVPMQIFSTDLHNPYLEEARTGFYPKALVQDVSPERLRRFFSEVEGGYRICKKIREMCVFARQNVLTDPPFSRLDLITCRNLLIYLKPEKQNEIIPLFHFALKPTGFLLLGRAEAISGFPHLFSQLNPKVKLFAKKPGPSLIGSHILPARPAHAAGDMPVSNLAPDAMNRAAGTASRAVRDRHGVPGRSASARTGRRIASGQHRFSGPPSRASKGTLQKQLVQQEEDVRVLLEQRDAQNEELQSANEEAQASNEELQSINEELATAKEELQASNEELTTVNEELQFRHEQVRAINNDLTNLLNSANFPIIMLGRDLRVRQFTPSTERNLDLVRADLARVVAELNLDIALADLKQALQEVIEGATPKEREVQDKRGHCYMLRLRPYLTAENKIDGAVIVLVDIDEIKRQQRQAHEALDYAQTVVNTVGEALLLLDQDLVVQWANPPFYETFNLSPGETEKRPIYKLEKGTWNDPELRRSLERMFSHKQDISNFELERPLSPERILSINGRRIYQPSNGREMVLLAIADVTDHRIADRLQLEKELLQAAEKERRRIGLSLHDQLGQQLTGIALLTKNLELTLTEENRPEAAAAKKIQKLINESIEHAREVARGLAGLALQQGGLLDALTDLATQARALFETQCDVVARGSIPRLKQEVGQHLYNIAQEAVTNAIRHGKATRIVISLVREGDWIILTVANNGKRFTEAPRHPSSGMGLRIIRYRAESIGAKIQIKAGAREGAVVTCALPAESAAASRSGRTRRVRA